MKFIFIVLAASLLCSCMNTKRNKDDINENKDIHILDEKSDKPLLDEKPIKQLPELSNRNGDFADIIQIKKKYERSSTSTFLGRERIKLFFKPNDSGYYGAYSLVNDSNENEIPIIVGGLTIYNDEIPWLYNNKSDRFIEMKIDHPGVCIFGEIEVGSDIDLLDKYLNNFYRKDDKLIVYVKEDVNLVALFKVENNKINWYSIGYYNSDVVSNIENYLSLLLE